MRLAEFLKTHAEEILKAWDAFAATVDHGGVPLDAKALRDHAAEILKTITADLERPQSEAQQDEKSKGRGRRVDGAADTAAETHADFRMISGFAVDAAITEYRALRASVLHRWIKAAGAGAVAADIGSVTRFNEAIDQAIAESVGRYTAQTKRSTELFIGILGHDIRNPLGTICMSAEYLVRSGQLAARAVDPIINSALRINRVIEHVVDFTRAQADGLLPVNPSPGDLALQFAKVIEETRVRHPKSEIRFEHAGSFLGNWDEGRMGQLMSNLLGNAVSYGARNQPVTVRLVEDGDQIRCTVHNFGAPIAAADQARIFQPLQRGTLASASQRRETEGLGLGLYISQEIVRAHGGTISLDSSAESGTTFTVLLPRGS